LPSAHLRIGAACVVGVVIIAWAAGLIGSGGSGPRDFAAELRLVQRAVESLPFAGKIKVLQEADGQIFVRGIIADNAERRAVVSTLEATHVPVKMRLATAQNIMMDVNNLIQAEGVQLKANLHVDGTLVLNGTILNPGKAKRVGDLIEAQVSGPVAVNRTGLKDGNDLLRDVVRASRSAEIGTSVSFALVESRMIEATGTLPFSSSTAWISFLRSYSENFAERVPLRSLVQVIVPENGTPQPVQISSQPIVLGATAGNDERVLDMGRLTSGNVSLADVFVSKPPTAVVRGASATGNGNEAARTATGARPGGAFNTDPRRPVDTSNADAAAGGATAGSAATSGPNSTAARNNARENILPTPADRLISATELKTLLGSQGASGALATNPSILIDRWVAGNLPTLPGKKEQLLVSTLDRLARQTINGQSEAQMSASRSDSELAKTSREFLTRDLRFSTRNENDCMDAWKQDPTLLPRLIFWLDVLSFSNSLSLVSFDKPMQVRLAQAMLNPYAVRRCLALLQPQEFPAYFERSAFIPEIIANPAFIRFLARDVANTSFDVSGAQLSGNRFVVTSDGKRYRNGMSVDLYSKIIDIGELGILIELSDRIEVVPLDRQLLWTVRRMSEIED
jgi:hypothetical protein